MDGNFGFGAFAMINVMVFCEESIWWGSRYRAIAKKEEAESVEITPYQEDWDIGI